MSPSLKTITKALLEAEKFATTCAENKKDVFATVFDLDLKNPKVMENLEKYGDKQDEEKKLARETIIEGKSSLDEALVKAEKAVNNMRFSGDEALDDELRGAVNHVSYLAEEIEHRLYSNDPDPSAEFQESLDLFTKEVSDFKQAIANVNALEKSAKQEVSHEMTM